jgi:fatty acid CoA ligase FadD9
MSPVSTGETVNKIDGSLSYKLRLAALTESDPQLRRLLPEPSVEAMLGSPGLSFTQAVATVLNSYESRPALGERQYDVVASTETGIAVRKFRSAFRTVTYGELRRRIEGLASAWCHSDHWRVEPGDCICILGFNGIDYATVDLACLYVQGVSVPLQSAIGRIALERIFADTVPTVVVATAIDSTIAAELVAKQKSVRTLVVIDYDELVEDDRGRYVEAQAVLAQNGSQARLVTLAELIAVGSAFKWEPLADSKQGAERVAMLMHSSGTTGTPKGAIMLERHAQSSFEASKDRLPRLRLCIAPMNHTIGRGTIYGAMAHGGIAYFITKPDLSTLFEDIRLVRPTDMYFFPRALEMVYRHFQLEVARRLRPSDADEYTVRAQVLTDMRDNFLGGRLCMIKGGGAPTKPEVRRFVVEGLQIEFLERYGTTEAGSITVNDRVRRPHVIDYRLRDVPELGYFTSDKPHPRGELCVKTAAVIPGYFKNPQTTAELFDSDGFVLTGDIVKELEPDHVVYLDRRNDVLKLAQGDFVAAGALGTMFENGSEVIHQIYIYGNPTRAYLLAVVVPNLIFLRLTMGREPDDVETRSLVKTELQKVGTKAGLKAFEIPRDVIIEREHFSQENGLLTGILKLVRPAMQCKYRERLERLYTDLESRHNTEVVALLRNSTELSPLEKIGKALELLLGLDHVDTERPSTIHELGGDSLAATELALLLEDIFGVDMPVSTILSRTGNPKDWARRIEVKLITQSHQMPSFAEVHGHKGVRVLNSADLHLQAFLSSTVLQEAPKHAPPKISHIVLLTGATGFLGRFLCLEWLDRLAASGGKLICLVRGSDREEARHRLDSVFSGGDADLEQRYRALAKDNLEVVVGDVTEVGLGVSDSEYKRLASEVDRIVHAAALVNHVLDYEHLFDSNVASTAALIGLALTKRQKSFDFVSSTAVFGLLDRTEHDDESSPLLDHLTLGQGYANGYRASKWASEHLLHAAGRIGLPINIFRCGMILPHRRFHGQINVDDIFTRLLYSVIVTAVAPTSFYFPKPDGTRAKAHYDGLPVDFTAAAIVGIGAIPHVDVRTLNVLNQHAEEGISLDVFVDWIEAIGYSVTRLVDYDEWFNRFELLLRKLPDGKRQISSLPVIESLRHPSNTSKPIPACGRFNNELRALNVQAPHLTKEYIGKCLDDMSRLGLIPTPNGGVTTELERVCQSGIAFRHC